MVFILAQYPGARRSPPWVHPPALPAAGPLRYIHRP